MHQWGAHLQQLHLIVLHLDFPMVPCMTIAPSNRRSFSQRLYPAVLKSSGEIMVGSRDCVLLNCECQDSVQVLLSIATMLRLLPTSYTAYPVALTEAGMATCATPEPALISENCAVCYHLWQPRQVIVPMDYKMSSCLIMAGESDCVLEHPAETRKKVHGCVRCYP